MSVVKKFDFCRVARAWMAAGVTAKIEFFTNGHGNSFKFDRGRLLTAMDSE